MSVTSAASFKFLGHGARVCNLPGTCPHSAMLLKEWTSRWIFTKPTLVVGGGVGRDTMRNMRAVQNRQDTIDHIRKLTWRSEVGNQLRNMSEFGVKNIKRTVWRGGTYFGVCNGAYIAGKQVGYNDYMGTNITHRGLGLFPGTTHGPMYPAASTNNDSIASAGGFPVNIVDAYGQKHATWYHNGGTFPRTVGRRRINYRVHATYDVADDHYPAIVSFRYGSGMVILSGIHPEFDGEGVDETSYRLFDGIFRKLGVVVR